jgi:hypothetical protein
MSYLLYCILSSHDTLDSPGLLGVGSEPVGLVSCNGLSAAVSKIDHYNVTPPISSLLEFKEVVESFHRSPAVRGVIPMRYGCMVDDKARILRLLEKHRSHYTALLKEVEGCVEMGIRILISECGMRSAECGVRNAECGPPNADSETPIQQIENPWPRPGMPGSSNGRTDTEQQQKQENIQITSHQGGRKSKIENYGKAYLAARKAHYAQEEKFNKQVEQVIERCRAAFSGLFVKCKTEVPSIANFQSPIFNPWPRPGLPRSSDRRPDREQQQEQENIQITSRQGGRQFSIANRFPSIYFLIPRESIVIFRRAFRRLIKSIECASLLLSGPWPPYNFIKPEHTEGGK